MLNFLFRGMLLVPLILINEAYCQDYIISLKEVPVIVKNRNFNIIEVFDSRPDQTKVGIVQTGMMNKKVIANLARGCAVEIKRFIASSFKYESGMDSIYLNILDLTISEETKALSENGYLKYHYQLLYYKDGELYEVMKISNEIKVSGMDVTTKHEGNIRSSLTEALSRLTSTNVEMVIREPVRMIIGERKRNYPIEVATTLNRGIYLSIEDFRQNRPSITREFEVRRKPKGARVWLGTVENKPFYLDEKGERIKITDEVWGFCDGEKSYIKARSDYFELINRSGVFEFWGYTTIAEQSGYAIGGLIGNIPQKALFVLDIETGRFSSGY